MIKTGPNALDRLARAYGAHIGGPGFDRIIRALRPPGGDRSFVTTVPYADGLYLEVDTSTFLGWFIYYHGAYRPLVIQALRTQLRPGDVAVDVGASIGDTAVVMASQVGPMGLVHAFEPWPSEFDRCCRNIERNGLSNVVTTQAALDERDGSMIIYGSAGTNTSAASARQGRHADVPIQVPAVRLDAYAAELNRLDLVKLDAQGAELPVLRGMKTTLARFRPTIVISGLHSTLCERFGYTIADVTALLDYAGYSVGPIEPHAHPARAQPLLAIAREFLTR